MCALGAPSVLSTGSHPFIGSSSDPVSFAWDAQEVPEAVREWYQFSDPVLLFARSLVEEGRASRDEILAIESRVRGEVAAAVQFAFDSPEPDPKSALENIFA